ncbi:Ribosomal protein S17 [Pelomyxa schiedti]|nr:Ribosomal protein S17 [Pelomyxa schiedti]
MSSVTQHLVQTQKAFQKYRPIFIAGKRQIAKGKTPKKTAATRYWKNIGLGFKTPEIAIKGNYVDKKCPFTSNVTIRGRILTGVVHSAKMERTVIVRRNYLHYIPKYQRYEKRHRNIPAHLSPCFDHVKEGDTVTIGECRPLTKTVRFNVIKVDRQKRAATFKAF